MTDAEGDIAVVVGATGGIGAALAEAIAASGRFASVIRLSRRSDPPLDLLDEESIAGAARTVAGQGVPRLVIVASGFLHDADMRPERKLAEIDAGYLQRSFAVNAIGPLLLMKYFLPLLPKTGRSVFAVLSARVGSIGDNRAGGWYGYRASKAALNQIVRTAAVELKRTRPDAACVAIHPGTVETPLSAGFARSGLPVQTPAQAADAILAGIAGLHPDDSGGFFDKDGRPIPW